jgi:transcriptional regulator with XRE-family HTH domain
MENGHSELDELYRTLGRRLAGIRREAGLTQAELAAQLRGTNRDWQQAVSRFEQGKAGQQSLAFILDYLRVCGTGLGTVLGQVQHQADQGTLDAMRPTMLQDVTAVYPMIASMEMQGKQLLDGTGCRRPTIPAGYLSSGREIWAVMRRDISGESPAQAVAFLPAKWKGRGYTEAVLQGNRTEVFNVAQPIDP